MPDSKLSLSKKSPLSSSSTSSKSSQRLFGGITDGIVGDGGGGGSGEVPDGEDEGEVGVVGRGVEDEAEEDCSGAGCEGPVEFVAFAFA